MAPSLGRQEPPPVVDDGGAAKKVNAQAPPAEAEGPSEHQLTGNASKEDGSYPRVPSLKRAIERNAREKASKSITVRPNKPVEPRSQQQDVNEDEDELPNGNEIVVVSGEGGKKGRAASDKQSPSKKARTPKVKRVFCDECIQRKKEPGDDGRGRKNAKHKCQKCAELTEMAAEQAERTPGRRRTTPAAGQERSISHDQNTGGDSLPASGKPRIATRPFKPHHKVEWASDPNTESDDPNNPPILNALNPLVDQFGVKGGLSRSSPPIQEDRLQRNEGPRSEAAIRKPDFYDDQDQPRRFSDAEVPPYQPVAFAPDAKSVFDAESALDAESAFETVNPAWLTRDPLSVAEEHSRYPDPTPSETPPPTNYFETAAESIEFSRAARNSTECLSNGASSSHSIPEVATTSNTYQAVLPNVSSVSSATDQPPANLSNNLHHHGSAPLPIDPRLHADPRHPDLNPSSNSRTLTGEPSRFSVPQASTSSVLGETGSHNNHDNPHGIDDGSKSQEMNLSDWLVHPGLAAAEVQNPPDCYINTTSQSGGPGPYYVPPRPETQPGARTIPTHSRTVGNPPPMVYDGGSRDYLWGSFPMSNHEAMAYHFGTRVQRREDRPQYPGFVPGGIPRW